MINIGKKSADYLTTYQNADGSWAWSSSSTTGNIDCTILSLLGLVISGYAWNNSHVQDAYSWVYDYLYDTGTGMLKYDWRLAYIFLKKKINDSILQNWQAQLLQTQNPGGGWGSNNISYATTTAANLVILGSETTYDQNYINSIIKGREWLIETQTASGGWSSAAQDNPESVNLSVSAYALWGLGKTKQYPDATANLFFSRPEYYAWQKVTAFYTVPTPAQSATIYFTYPNRQVQTVVMSTSDSLTFTASINLPGDVPTGMLVARAENWEATGIQTALARVMIADISNKTTNWVNYFNYEAEDWQSLGIPSTLTAEASNGMLNLKANEINSFGFWAGPFNYYRVLDDSLYKATYKVYSDIDNAALVPEVRCRANRQDNDIAGVLGITSENNGVHSATKTIPKTYTLFFRPQQAGVALPVGLNYISPAFDLLAINSNDTWNAVVSLDEFTLNQIPLNMIDYGFTDVVSYTFEESTEGWIFYAPSTMTPPISSHLLGSLVLISANNTSCFGMWQSPSIAMDTNTLYKVKATIESNQTYSAVVPQFRLRLNSSDFTQYAYINVVSQDNSGNSPTQGNPRDYELYFLSPTNIFSSEFFVSFDILNIDPNDSATAALMLNSLTITSFKDPYF